MRISENSSGGWNNCTQRCKEAPMSRASRMATNVVVMALFGWCPLLGATESSIAPGSPAWVVESAEYTGEVKEQIARIEARYTIRVIREGWTEEGAPSEQCH